VRNASAAFSERTNGTGQEATQARRLTNVSSGQRQQGKFRRLAERFGNVAHGEFKDLQSGLLLNYSHECSGLQLSLVNVATNNRWFNCIQTSWALVVPSLTGRGNVYSQQTSEAFGRFI